MITFEPFWETLKEKGITTYYLINKKGLSSSLINRLKKNKSITTTTLNDLCTLLDCEISDIIKYVADDGPLA